MSNQDDQTETTSLVTSKSASEPEYERPALSLSQSGPRSPQQQLDASEPEPDKIAMSLYQSGHQSSKQQLTTSASGSGSPMPSTSLSPHSPYQESENKISSDEEGLQIQTRSLITLSSESEPEPDKPAMSLYKSGPRTPQQHLTASGSGSHMPATSLMPLSPEQELENGASSDEVYVSLGMDMVKQTAMKKELTEIYEKTKSLFYPGHMMDGLKEIMDVITKVNYLENISANLQKLESEECPILVAGETSSGKSTVINLLIGDELLPYSVLHKTAAICCLRHCDEKKLVYEISGESKEEQFEKSVSTKDVKSRIDTLMNTTDVKLINIYWPIPLLENQVNVILVDTPGLGDNDHMVEMLMQFLPNAVGFIYVINSANAGGIEKNKMIKLLDEQLRMELLGKNLFDISSTIFVCNKWDQVPADEDAHVMGFIQSRLQECMAVAEKHIDVDKQVLRFSGKKALKAIRKDGRRTGDFEALLGIMKAFVPKCLEMKYVQLYRWLRESVVEDIYQIANNRLRNGWTSMEERKKLQADVEKHLMKLTKDCREVLIKMHSVVKTFCTETAKRLHAYLNSRDVKNKLLNWEPNEMPKTKSAKLEEELEKKIRERVETEIGLWKTNDETFRNELDKIRGKCSKLCEGIKNDMDKINRMIEGAGDIVDLPKKRIKEQDGLLDGFIDKSAGLKAAALITAPIWLPAALVVGMFIIPIWGIGSVTKAVATDIKDTHRRASQRRQYEHNMHKYIENFTSDFLREQITEQCLTDTIIKKQNESYLKAVDTLYKVTIPQRLETNRRFLKTIMKEGATSKETKAMFRPVRECLKGILTQMTKLRIQFLVNPCFAKRDIEIQSTISSRSKIDEIQFPVNHSNRKAAVKTIHLSDMEKLQEADRLLSLNHQNIVSMFGIVHEGTQQCGIIMELCKCDAEAMFLHNASGTDSGGKGDDRKQAMQLYKVIRVGTCRALKYLHEMDCLHGNLKLSKILISNNNEPKLTGFGSILYIDAPASRTMSGLSHYAPEVLMGRPYRWSSDVYSFGIVCSEMLLRHHVFADEELTSYNPKAFAVKLESEGYIHSVTKSDETRLRKELKDIEHCLHPRFEKRPNIADMLPK